MRGFKSVNIPAGWFTTFFKDAVDPEDNFDSRPGANLFIKHIKYETLPGVTAAPLTNQQATNQAADSNTNKQTDTESIPFNNIFTRKEAENEYADRKQVDAEEELLKRRYEEGDGGAADGEGGVTTAAEDTTVTAATETTETAETPSKHQSCFSKIIRECWKFIIHNTFVSLYSADSVCLDMSGHVQTCQTIFTQCLLFRYYFRPS